MRLGPGCCCDVDNCGVYFTDDFNRGALGSDWTAAAGSPSISGNQMQLAPGDFAVCAVAAPTIDQLSLAYKARGATTNDLLYVANTYFDLNNYTYIKQIIDTGSANGIPWIGNRVAGVNTDLDFYGYAGSGVGVGSSLSGTHLSACVDDGFLAGGGSGPGGGLKVSRPGGNLFGFYAPATNSSNVFIDDVIAAGVDVGCDCACSSTSLSCCRWLLDRTLELVISGITTSGFTDLNGTYNLVYEGYTDQGFGAGDPIFVPLGTYGVNQYIRLAVPVSGKASGVTFLVATEGGPCVGGGGGFSIHFTKAGCNYYIGFVPVTSESGLYDCSDPSSQSYGPKTYKPNFCYSSGSCGQAINAGASLVATVL